MKIGIVTGRISKSPAGLERYNVELVNNLASFDSQNEYLFYVRSGSNTDFINKDKINNLKIIEVGGGVFWKEIGMFFAPKADVYIFSGLQMPLIFTPKKFIVVVLDLWFKISKPVSFKAKVNSFLLNVASKKVAQKASSVVAISESAKDDFIKFFNPVKTPVVIYPGFNKICSLDPKAVGGLPEKFFLFVGTVKSRKNVLNIIKAFKLFSENNKEFKLVIAGNFNKNSEYGVKLTTYIKENKMENGVLFLGHVGDHELCYLYKKAEAFVFPSVLEGFGFPVVEAMHCGLPVITSKGSSLGEIAGESAILVNHNSPEEISSAMGEVIKRKEELISRGRENADKFSWEKMAESFIKNIKAIY